jgi:outer membrane protein assembly factor BamB
MIRFHAFDRVLKSAKQLAGSFALGLLLIGAAASARAQNAAVYTYHDDTLRTGWQQNETVLTTSNAGQVTLLHTLNVKGRISAQPLVVPNQSVNGVAAQSVVYVVTDQDYLYAFDGATGEELGSTKFGPAVPITALPGRCTANSQVVGITSTPVIDPQAGLIYLITDTYEANQAVYRVHAVSLSTLQDTVTPAPVVSASASLLDGSQYAFNASVSRQRASLLLSGGTLYATFTSYCDQAALQTRGWVLGWRTPGLAMLSADYLTNLVAPTPTLKQFLTSIWMSGYGLSTLKAGDNIYFATGNTHHGTYAVPSNLSESVVKVAPNLSAIQGFFTDPQQVYEDTNDLELGSGGVMVLPPMPGANPRLLIAGGKLGNMYLLAANNMKLLATYSIGPCWCGPSFYQGADGVYRVVSSGGASVIVWDLATSNSSPAKLTQEREIPIASGQDGGFFTTVSSNGVQPGAAIIWAVGRPTAIPGAPTLYAIDPTTGNILLQTPAGSWTNGASNANIVPTVANGRVYVGSTAQLQIFGLPPAAGAMAAAAAPFATANEGAPAVALTRRARPGERTVTGWIRQEDQGWLTIETRAGQSVRVDERGAEAAGNAVPAAVGQAVEVIGTVSLNDVLLASSVVHAKQSPAFWSADQ